MRPRSAGLLLALAGLLLTAAAVPAQAAPPAQPGQPASAQPGQPGQPSAGFVTRHGADLKLDGRKFRFAGTNNYYLMK